MEYVDWVIDLSRDQYGLVRPGETGYVIVPPAESEFADTDEAVPVEEEHRPWWTRLWDWITGNDLERDG